MMQVKITKEAVEYVMEELHFSYEEAIDLLQMALSMCKFEEVVTIPAPPPTGTDAARRGGR